MFVSFWLAVPVQLIAWKDSSLKLPIRCRVGRQPYTTTTPSKGVHQLQKMLYCLVINVQCLTLGHSHVDGTTCLGLQH